VAQPVTSIAWPFAGRIFRIRGNQVRDYACVCRRVTTGVHLEPYMPDILPAKAKLWLEEYREAAPPFAPGELLGVATAPQLTARDGLLLSDWAFLQDPWLMDRLSPPEDPSLVDDSNHPEDPRLAAYSLPDPWSCVLGLSEYITSLTDRLRTGAVTLSGLMWPLRPQPVEQAITAATLPMWTIDLATDFAALTTDPSVLLCDLRVIETPIPSTASSPASPRKEPPAGHKSSNTRPNYASFVPIMRQAIDKEEAGSAREAAGQVVDKVPGPATRESKIDRLRTAYGVVYGRRRNKRR
jgi:hypothetical protein